MDKPLRICHIIHNTECGGTETMLFRVLRQLSGQHEMSVVSLMRCGEVGERIRQLGIPVHAMECTRGRKPRPERFIGVIGQIRKLRPDVVQTWAYHADLCGGVAARLATNAAVIWNIRHATLDPKVDSKNVLRSAGLCARLSKWVPDRILLNAQSAVEVHASAGYDRRKMQVLPNGFDVERFCPRPDDKLTIRNELRIPSDVPVVGMCGRFHPHKGQSEFVKVARRLADDWPTTHFLIAGNQCDDANVELTTWIENAGLTSRFRLLGSRNDIPQILNAMDVYLLPSLTEGMPNVVGEAMACGVSTVSTDVGDAAQLIGDCGTVVRSEDIAAMASAVVSFLTKTEAERAAFGARARKRIVDNFDITAVAQLYASTWLESLDRRAAARRTSRTVASVPPATKLRFDTASTSDSVYRPKLVHVTTIPMTQCLFLRGQNGFMSRQGFDVHSVSSPGPYMQKLRDRDPVTTHEISISRRIQPVRDSLAAYRLYRLFRTLRPEVVQLSTPKAALLGAIAAKVARVPVRIYQVRGLSSESESGTTRRVFQWLERATASLCNGYLVNAVSLLEYAQRAKILRSGYVAGQGMSNGVDLRKFNPASVRAADLKKWDDTGNDNIGPVIGYIGRLTRDKGLEDLYQAWRELRDEFPASRLLLVGPWESENAVSKECRDGLHIDDRVIMTGTQDDVASLYKTMDLFVFPSHGTEGYPNAPMEAAAMGLPVIATRVVGCVDAVVDGITGKIISPRVPVELEATLRTYLRDPDLRAAHGAAGRERIRSGFAPQDLWAEFREYYFHLLRREGLPLPTQRPETQTLPKAA